MKFVIVVLFCVLSVVYSRPAPPQSDVKIDVASVPTAQNAFVYYHTGYIPSVNVQVVHKREPTEIHVSGVGSGGTYHGTGTLYGGTGGHQIIAHASGLQIPSGFLSGSFNFF